MPFAHLLKRRRRPPSLVKAISPLRCGPPPWHGRSGSASPPALSARRRTAPSCRASPRRPPGAPRWLTRAHLSQRHGAPATVCGGPARPRARRGSPRAQFPSPRASPCGAPPSHATHIAIVPPLRLVRVRVDAGRGIDQHGSDRSGGGGDGGGSGGGGGGPASTPPGSVGAPGRESAPSGGIGSFSCCGSGGAPPSRETAAGGKGSGGAGGGDGGGARRCQ